MRRTGRKGWLITQMCLISCYVSVRAVETSSPPEFVKRPSNAVLVEGVRAQLNCLASGHPKPTYKWHHDSKTEGVVSDDRRYALSNGSLIFNPFNKTLDEGIYYCRAKNRLSSILSEGALIEGAVPPVVTLPPRNMTVNESGNVTFTCAGNSFPSPTYTWMLRHDETFRQTGANNKMIYVTPRDSGEYTCEVSNIAGRATATAFLHVKYSPSAIISPPALTIAHHETPTLICRFKGYPVASVQWLANEQRLTPGRRVNINTEITSTLLGEGKSHLTLKNLHRQDSGTYTCVVTNELGSFNVTSQLYVQFPPDPPMLEGHVAGTTVILGWSVITKPAPPITSFTVTYGQKDESKNGLKQINLDAVSQTTSVESLKKGTAYDFNIIASNSIGHSSPSNLVTLEIAPTVPDAAPDLLSTTPLSSSSAHVKWNAVLSNGGSQITHYTLQYKTVQGDEWHSTSVNGYTNEHTVQGLASNTTYIFRVLAKNAVGVSKPSAPLPVKTLVIGTPSMVSHLVVYDVLETTAKVRWMVPDSRLEKNQKITSYNILLAAKNNSTETHREEVNAPFAIEGGRIEYKLENLLCGVTYQVTVSALNNEGRGPWSSLEKFTTRAKETTDLPAGEESADAGSIVKDNVAYIAAGVASIVVFSAIVVVIIVWRCHRVATDDTGSSTATMKSDIESSTVSLQYSPAKHPSTDIRIVHEDERILSVRMAFEQALAPTPPESARADRDNPFISLGDDTLGEEQIPSHLGSQVNSFHEAGYMELELGKDRSKSLSVDGISESSDEAKRKKNVRFGTPDVLASRVRFGSADGLSSKRMAVSPARSLPSNHSYSLRGIQLKDKSTGNSSS